MPVAQLLSGALAISAMIASDRVVAKEAPVGPVRLSASVPGIRLPASACRR